MRRALARTGYRRHLPTPGDGPGHESRCNEAEVLISHARVVSAYIQFKADEATGDPTILTIHGEASDDAAPFVVVRGNISSRATTSASATWSPDPWTLVGEMGAPQRTADLVAIIQQIVGRRAGPLGIRW